MCLAADVQTLAPPNGYACGVVTFPNGTSVDLSDYQGEFTGAVTEVFSITNSNGNWTKTRTWDIAPCGPVGFHYGPTYFSQHQDDGSDCAVHINDITNPPRAAGDSIFMSFGPTSTCSALYSAYVHLICRSGHLAVLGNESFFNISTYKQDTYTVTSIATHWVLAGSAFCVGTSRQSDYTRSEAVFGGLIGGGLLLMCIAAAWYWWYRSKKNNASTGYQNLGSSSSGYGTTSINTGPSLQQNFTPPASSQPAVPVFNSIHSGGGGIPGSPLASQQHQHQPATLPNPKLPHVSIPIPKPPPLAAAAATATPATKTATTTISSRQQLADEILHVSMAQPFHFPPNYTAPTDLARELKSSAVLQSKLKFLDQIVDGSYAVALQRHEDQTFQQQQKNSQQHQVALLDLNECFVLALYSFDIGPLGPVEENFYIFFNSHLRKRNPGVSRALVAFCWYFKKAWEKLRPMSGKVYRGISLQSAAQLDAVKQEYMPGRQVYWSAISQRRRDCEELPEFGRGSGAVSDRGR